MSNYNRKSATAFRSVKSLAHFLTQNTFFSAAADKIFLKSIFFLNNISSKMKNTVHNFCFDIDHSWAREV